MTFRLANSHIEMTVDPLGCTIQSIIVNGKNIVLAGQGDYYLGTVIGRYAGRISGASFEIDGRRYPLSCNEASRGNHLHGGFAGFDKRLFEVTEHDESFLKLRMHSADLEEGYPGELELHVSISLNDPAEISIRYEATSSRDTHVNLTHHHYFNLTGGVDALEQHLQIDADTILEQNEDYIPDGSFKKVEGTKYDFRNARRISEGGYNHYYILSGACAATLTDPVSGLQLQITTSYPGVLFYSGDFLGEPFQPCQGVCLETQFYPDSPNRPGFPSTILRAGQTYRHETRMILKNIG